METSGPNAQVTREARLRFPDRFRQRLSISRLLGQSFQPRTMLVVSGTLLVLTLAIRLLDTGERTSLASTRGYHLQAAAPMSRTAATGRFRLVPVPTSEPDRPGGFWMGETEVTEGQWEKVVGLDLGGSPTGCGQTCPVVGVNVFDAAQFANSLSASEGLAPCFELKGCKGSARLKTLECTSIRPTAPCDGYRLPALLEYSFAAYSAPSEIKTSVARSLATKQLFPVAIGAPNQFGLHNLDGNALELTMRELPSSAESEFLACIFHKTRKTCVAVAANSREHMIGFRLLLDR